MNTSVVKRNTKQNALQKINLNAREIAFCEYILLDESSRNAYRLAGYSPGKNDNVTDASASRLLNSVKIQGYLTQRREQIEKLLQERTNVTKERILKELETVGFSRITDYLRFDERGVTMKDSDTIEKNKIGAVMSVKSQTRSIQTEDGPEILSNQTEFRTHPKVEALIKLGEGLGYFKSNTPAQTNVQVNIHLIGNGNQRKRS